MYRHFSLSILVYFLQKLPLFFYFCIIFFSSFECSFFFFSPKHLLPLSLAQANTKFFWEGDRSFCEAKLMGGTQKNFSHAQPERAARSIYSGQRQAIYHFSWEKKKNFFKLIQKFKAYRWAVGHMSDGPTVWLGPKRCHIT